MGEAEALEKAEDEGRRNKPKGDGDEEDDGELDSMKEIFADEPDLEDFEYESSSFFNYDKNYQNNGDKEEKDDDNLDPIQMGTSNTELPTLD